MNIDEIERELTDLRKRVDQQDREIAKLTAKAPVFMRAAPVTVYGSAVGIDDLSDTDEAKRASNARNRW